MSTPPPDVFDIYDSRADRARQRAARREGRGDTLAIRFKGADVATLEAEFPLDVLEPLQRVNVDVTLLVRQAMDLAKAEGSDEQMAMLGFIVDVLAANPELPKELVGAVKEMARRLFGQQGYEALVTQRPTPWDIGALIGRLMGWYGVNLGESSGSSTPVPAGATSNTISNSTSESTPEISGEPLPTEGSSESAA